MTAAFSDVSDLAKWAPVTLSDVKVGKVTGISLRGNQALVTMELNKDAHIPADVMARVQRESVLGERIVQLIVPRGSDAPALQDGDRIDNTIVRPDLEALVEEGSSLFGAIEASELATMIDEGARGFGGQGQRIATLLKNLRAIVKGFDSNSEDIKAMISHIGDLNAQLAPHAAEHARAIASSQKAIHVLRENENRLARALQSLARLSHGSEYMLNRHVDEMTRFFSQTRLILGILASDQEDIRRLLIYAPRHNRNTQAVEYGEFNQILQDFVICGLNDNPRDPARSCEGGRD